MFQIFSNKKTSLDSPDQLFFFLDKIINICLIKIERGEIKSARKILLDLELFLNKFWTLKKVNPGRFLSLVSTQEIYNNACPIKIPGHFYEMDSFDAQCADNLKVQNLLLSQLQTGREIKGFGRLLGGFERIWEKAFHFEQQEITTGVFQILDHFLKTLLDTSYNDLFVETVLKVYLSIFERLLNVPENSMVEYEIRGSLLWYQKYQLNRESLKKPFDDFLYEDVLDQFIYKFIMLMVNAKQETAFEIFLSLLSEKTDTMSMTDHSLLDFFHILEKGSRKQFEKFKEKNFFLDTIEKLNVDLNHLESLPKIRGWIAREEELLNQIRPSLEISQVSHFYDIEKDIQKYLQFLLKKQKILEIIDITIAYGLARNKTIYTKSIFNYRLPYDNFHNWFVGYILPKTYEEILLFLNKMQKTITKYSVSEGLKIHESFYEKTSLLLISSLILENESNGTAYNQGQLAIKEKGSTLSAIKICLATLLSRSHLMMKEKNILHDIGVSDDLSVIHWKEHVIPFLEQSILTIDLQINELKTAQKLSQSKVDDFKMATWGNFVSNAVMRKLFDKFKPPIFEEFLPLENHLERVGLNVIDEKSQFLEDWDNTCDLQMVDYGLRLAYSEDLHIFTAIRKLCTKISWNQLLQSDAIKLDHCHIMIATDLSYQSVLLKKPNFSTEWGDYKNENKLPFQFGQYSKDGMVIPVIVIQRIKDEEGIVILDKTSMGEWHQYSPLNPGEAETLQHKFLYLDVQAFSEKQELMEEYLHNPPSWLRDLGSIEKQKSYLQEHILIHIFERFQWLPTSFSGAFSLEDSF